MLKLTQLYIKEIKEGSITIDDVPTRLRESVQNQLNDELESGE